MEDAGRDYDMNWVRAQYVPYILHGKLWVVGSLI